MRMIPNLDLSPHNILSQLNFSTHKFYLTGSRYFSCPHPNSDWDFFTDANGKNIVSYLKSKGFERIPMNPDWFDSLTCGIYRHPAFVEVALVENVNLKRKAQIFITEIEPRYLHLLKDTPMNKQDIWNEVYDKCLHKSIPLI